MSLIHSYYYGLKSMPGKNFNKLLLIKYVLVVGQYMNYLINLEELMLEN